MLKFLALILMAQNLGVEFFAIYSFALLLVFYLSYFNLGVNFSINNFVSNYKNYSSESISDYTSNAVTINTLSFLFVLLGSSLLLFTTNIFNASQYKIESYLLLLIITVLIKQINSIYINISRTMHRLSIINFAYFLPVLIDLVLIIIFKGEELFYALLFGLFISNILIFFVFIWQLRIQDVFKMNLAIFRELISKGFILLLYNLSFSLMFISFRTVISAKFSLEDFALFSFALSLSESIGLIIGVIGFVLYPKILNNLSIKDDFSIIFKVQETYLNLAILLTFVIILLSPIVFSFLPEYRESYNTFVILSVAQILLVNCFSHTTFLIFKSQEKKLIFYGLLSVMVIVASLHISIILIKETTLFSGLSLIFGLILYNFLVIRRSYEIGKKGSSKFDIDSFRLFELRKIIPVLAILLLAVNSELDTLSLLIISSTYCFLNYSKIKENFIDIFNILKISNYLKLKGKEEL